jgi:hypothetical protein
MEIPKYLDPEWLIKIKGNTDPSCGYFPKDTILMLKISDKAVIYKVIECTRFVSLTINPLIND